MKQNKFDLVMDYIDVNVSQDVEAIKKGIFNLIGYTSNVFGNCFQILTNKTLFHYINERKMFFAAQSLKNDTDRSIADIALDWDYSDQSSFTRALKSYCGATPLEVRKGMVSIPDTKYNLATLCMENKSDDEKVQHIGQEWRDTGDLSMSNCRRAEMIEAAVDRSIFDVDTCSAIFELSERLEISFWKLLDQCEEYIIDVHSNPDGISPKIEKAIDCGISSSEELEAICNYYNCKYYDLDVFMVDCYREHLKSE